MGRRVDGVLGDDGVPGDAIEAPGVLGDRSAVVKRDAAPHPKRADHDEAVALGDRGEGADRVEGAVAPQEDALSGGVPRASRQRSLAVFLRRFSAVSRRGSHHARC